MPVFGLGGLGYMAKMYILCLILTETLNERSKSHHNIIIFVHFYCYSQTVHFCDREIPCSLQHGTSSRESGTWLKDFT